MFTYATNKDRLPLSTTELNAQLLGGEGPGTVVNRFIMSVTAETFEERYAELVPELQDLVRHNALINVDNFDRIIAFAREDGVYAEGWLAFRDWTRRQPWLADAIAQQQGAKAYTVEEFEALQQRFSEEGAELARLRVLRMRATTDAERAELTDLIEETERRFANANDG